MKADHLGDANKMIGLDTEYDPLEKWAFVAQELAQKLKAANGRIKKLEEQILKAQKQKEIVNKVIAEISQEEPSNKKIVALLNQHFWELV